MCRVGAQDSKTFRGWYETQRGDTITVKINGLTHSFPTHPFYTPWKYLKTVRFSDVFRGYRKGALGTNELKAISLSDKIVNNHKFSEIDK